MSSRLPGFRFYPTEQELVHFYLRNKLENRLPEIERLIPVVDVYSYEPAELPQLSGEESVHDQEQWFFFCPRQDREAHGGRPTRTTRSGYWKATGSPSRVIHDDRVIGRKKTMVFYEGRVQKGSKTSWKMNEYKAYEEPSTSSETLQLRNEFSLCRVYKTSGCLRSFDRRPTVATPGTNASNVDPSVAVVGTSSHHGNPTMATAAMEPSPGSSPSADQLDAAGEGTEGEMALEELDWGSLFEKDESLI